MIYICYACVKITMTFCHYIIISGLGLIFNYLFEYILICNFRRRGRETEKFKECCRKCCLCKAR